MLNWLKRPASRSAAPKNERAGYRQPVDLPVQLLVTGIRLPVNATIVNVSVTGCRLKSWIAIERDAKIAFEWPREGVDLRLTGTIVMRQPSDEGAAFEYGISFEGLLPAQADLLAREIHEAQRREALNRSMQAKALNVKPADVNNRRSAYRAKAEFRVDIVREDGKLLPIKVSAVDISSGGLRVTSERPLTPQDEVTVRFRLPDDVLKIFPPGVQEEVVNTPFGPRKHTKNRRKPFEEMRIRSRITAQLADYDEKPAFGIAFVELDVYTREEIARFIHAVQLEELRNRKASR
jgi:hypothetical protein